MSKEGQVTSGLQALAVVDTRSPSASANNARTKGEVAGKRLSLRGLGSRRCREKSPELRGKNKPRENPRTGVCSATMRRWSCPRMGSPGCHPLRNPETV